MSKSLEELKNEKLKIFLQDNHEKRISRGLFYHKDAHREILEIEDSNLSRGFKTGFEAAIKAVSEREKKISEKEIVDIITEWKYFWMNQTQNNQQDYENYFRRASGVDANMKYNLAKRICEALKDYRGGK